MIDVNEIQNRIDGMYAEPSSEEGQAEIHDPDNTHVLEVWEDGELTSTKCGDLYGHRNLHQNAEPILPAGQVLFTMDDLDDDYDLYNALKRRDKHKRMVVTDRELKEILEEYRKFIVNKRVIDQFEECDNCMFGFVHSETGICTDCNHDVKPA